jgi:hypothetical protein
MRKFTITLAVLGGALMMALSSTAAAASTCPAPGTAQAGALNMTAAGAGMVHAMSVDAQQGNDGMYIAVANTAC